MRMWQVPGGGGPYVAGPGRRRALCGRPPTRSGTRRGALTGLSATGGVITSAGLVLAGTFAMLSTLPLVEFTEIGFAVALGVLLDTIVVRSVLVTALTLDIGRHVWWPSALAKPEANPESGALTDAT